MERSQYEQTVFVSPQPVNQALWLDRWIHIDRGIGRNGRACEAHVLPSNMQASRPLEYIGRIIAWVAALSQPLDSLLSGHAARIESANLLRNDVDKCKVIEEGFYDAR